MALSGHILQWTGLSLWTSVLERQLRALDVTNEDMVWDLHTYLETAVQATRAKARYDLGRLGGRAVVDRFITTV